MRFSGKIAARVGALGIAVAAVALPASVAHAATPAITVTPNTGLTDGATVTVAGTGYTSGATVAILECSTTPVTAQTACDTTNTNTATVGTDGTFTKTVTVHTGTIGSGTCAAGSTTCSIEAANIATQTEQANAGIGFAAAATGPAITVTPATGLTDGQSVTVAGTGFKATATYYVSECSALTGLAACDSTLTDIATGMTGADGSFSTTYKVKEGTIGSGTCPPADATASCYLVATTDPTGADTTQVADEAITFAGATGPTITISPDTNVADGQTVKVSGSGFPAKAEAVYVLECSGTTGEAACDTGTVAIGSTDKTGAFTDVGVKVHEGAVGNGTCAAGGTCYIAASTSTTPDPTQSASNTFTFGTGGHTTKAAKTKTSAKFSKKKDAIAGVVSSHGKGVKGLKTELDMKKGGGWKKVDSAKTHKGGAFIYKHVKSGKYRVESHKTKSYKASSSKTIKAKA